MNVSKEADAAFVRELERTDPQRHANLMQNMRRTAGAISLARRRGRPKKHKDNAARQRAYRNKGGVAETVTKPLSGPFIPQELQAQFEAPVAPMPKSILASANPLCPSGKRTTLVENGAFSQTNRASVRGVRRSSCSHRVQSLNRSLRDVSFLTGADVLS
jgi:hypothetical protein